MEFLEQNQNPNSSQQQGASDEDTGLPTKQSEDKKALVLVENVSKKDHQIASNSSFSSPSGIEMDQTNSDQQEQHPATNESKKSVAQQEVNLKENSSPQQDEQFTIGPNEGEENYGATKEEDAAPAESEGANWEQRRNATEEQAYEKEQQLAAQEEEQFPAEKMAEEERLAAEKRAEEERGAAEAAAAAAKAETERLAAEAAAAKAEEERLAAKAEEERLAAESASRGAEERAAAKEKRRQEESKKQNPGAKETVLAREEKQPLDQRQTDDDALPQTPRKNKSKAGGTREIVDTVSPARTAETEASSVASLTPQHTVTWNLESAANPQSSASTKSISIPPSIPEPEPTNEFQMVQLRKSTITVERHIKETKLEFAEMVASALKKKNDASSGSSTNLEAFRHIDDLKQEVALLQEQDDDGLWAIRKLRQDLLDLFNKGGSLQEEYLLRWLLPLHRERDPKTGRLVMDADQVALLQSFSTSEELNMVSGLGMVRAILQSNFKAINGAQCLEAINQYACFRLGTKVRRGPQNPWELLADLFEAEQNGDAKDDIHLRVRNALSQWVVREILGSTQDEVSSRNCFHAIFLIASLKLELQRLAPAALEQAPSIEMLEDGSTSTSSVTGSPSKGCVDPSSPPRASVRPPVVEQLLRQNILNDGIHASSTAPHAYKNPDTVAKRPLTDSVGVATAVASYDPSTESNFVSEEKPSDDVRDSTVDKDEAMKAAMIARDNSRKPVASQEEKPAKEGESELPLAVRDAHRVIRCILGPNHPNINVSDCFDAIRIYSSLIMDWKDVSERNQQLLEEGSTCSSQPTYEEMKLKSLERRIIDEPMEPPSHIGVDIAEQERQQSSMNEKTKEKRRKKRRKKKQEKQKESATSGRLPPAEEAKQEETSENSQQQEPEAPAQLDIEGLLAETSFSPTAPDDISSNKPGPESPPSSSKKEAAASVQARSQKAAEATELQAETRKHLFAKLRLIKTKQENARSSSEALASGDDPRHPRKRRARWKKFLGV
jgi:hypothetical protein